MKWKKCEWNLTSQKISKIPDCFVGTVLWRMIIVIPKTRTKHNSPLTSFRFTNKYWNIYFLSKAKYYSSSKCVSLKRYRNSSLHITTAQLFYVIWRKDTYDLFSHTFWLEWLQCSAFFSCQKRSSSWPIISPLFSFNDFLLLLSPFPRLQQT